nr:hypothetical protein [Spirochaeta sp.]
LARVYEEADRDGDGTLSFTEIQAFQRWVFREFRYQTNHTALSPDRFGALGGGDCEDYSLYTCGLLAYWGYECYVGVFASPDDPDAQLSHAVALLAVPGPVKIMELVTTDDNPQFPAAARNRTFVPIDYDVVGGFTNATPNPRVLYGIYEATKIYGTWM